MTRLEQLGDFLRILRFDLILPPRPHQGQKRINGSLGFDAVEDDVPTIPLVIVLMLGTNCFRRARGIRVAPSRNGIPEATRCSLDRKGL